MRALACAIGLVGLLLVLPLISALAQDDDYLTPREIAPKVPLDLPLLPLNEDLAFALVVKFMDASQARAQEDGSVQFLGEGSSSEANSLAQAYGVRFRGPDLPAESLASFELAAASRSGREQPDFAGILRAVFEEHVSLATAVAVANSFQALPEVEFASLSFPSPNAPSCDLDNHIPPEGEDFIDCQQYRGADPGIGAEYAHSIGATGQGIRITDIETWWDVDHEDMGAVTLEGGFDYEEDLCEPTMQNNDFEHGTCVLGITSAIVGNSYGCEGLCADAAAHFHPARVYPNCGPQEPDRFHSALLSAAAASGPGDVIVIEQQVPGGSGALYVPMETVRENYLAIKASVDAGIVVVEAAGNSFADLDTYLPTWLSWGDSGALIVGAGTADAAHALWDPSDGLPCNYGARINVQSWAEKVFSLGSNGPNNVFFTDENNSTHTDFSWSFRRTSAATAIVGGACPLVESFAVSVRGDSALNAWEVRNLLRESGIPQGGDNAEDYPIGPALDLQAAFLLYEQGWLDASNGLLYNMHQGRGIAWADLDADWDLDLYVTNQDAQNLLSRNYDHGANFLDIGQVLGLSILDSGPGAGTACADYDNDGDLDVYLANNGSANRLFKHLAGLSFSEVGASLQVNDTGAGQCVAWADYDADGEIDLFVGNANGQADLLYHNNLDPYGQPFTNCASAAGMNDTGNARGAAWCDFDVDGDQDLVVSNLGAANRLYVNDGGAFTNEADGYGIEDDTWSTGVAWGDYDNDGDFDLFVGGTADVPSRLYRNDGSEFVDVGDSAGLADAAAFTLGATWGDYDNDGDLDIYVANMYVSGYAEVYSKLYENIDGLFEEIQNDFLGSLGSMNDAAWGDYNNDGRLDLYLVSSSTAIPSRLLRNTQDADNAWLVARLQGDGDNTNRAAIGVRAVVHAGSTAITRHVSGGCGSFSQNSLELEFGLGAAEAIDSIEVFWENGHREVHTGVVVNSLVEIEEGQSLEYAGKKTVRIQPETISGLSTYPSPFNPRTEIRFVLAQAGAVHVDIVDVLGRSVRTLASGKWEAGPVALIWDGRDSGGASCASGVYFVRIRAGGAAVSTKIVLLK